MTEALLTLLQRGEGELTSVEKRDVEYVMRHRAQAWNVPFISGGWDFSTSWLEVRKPRPELELHVIAVTRSSSYLSAIAGSLVSRSAHEALLASLAEMGDGCWETLIRLYANPRVSPAVKDSIAATWHTPTSTNTRNGCSYADKCVSAETAFHLLGCEGDDLAVVEHALGQRSEFAQAITTACRESRMLAYPPPGGLAWLTKERLHRAAADPRLSEESFQKIREMHSPVNFTFDLLERGAVHQAKHVWSEYVAHRPNNIIDGIHQQRALTDPEDTDRLPNSCMQISDDLWEFIVSPQGYTRDAHQIVLQMCEIRGPHGARMAELVRTSTVLTVEDLLPYQVDPPRTNFEKAVSDRLTELATQGNRKVEVTPVPVREFDSWDQVRDAVNTTTPVTIDAIVGVCQRVVNNPQNPLHVRRIAAATLIDLLNNQHDLELADTTWKTLGRVKNVPAAPTASLLQYLIGLDRVHARTYAQKSVLTALRSA